MRWVAMGFQSGGIGGAVEAWASEGGCCHTSMRLGLGAQCSVWRVGRWLGVEAGEEAGLGRGVREHA
jgi:hypothetical protein